MTLSAALIFVPLSLFAAESQRAEYAFRWDPTEGGPRTIQEALTMLGIQDKKPESFTVRYYTLPRPSWAPDSAAVILRERTSKVGERQFRLKFRSSSAFSPQAQIPENFGEVEQEVDVTFLDNGKVRRMHSLFLSSEDSGFVAQLNGKPNSSAATMERFEDDKVRVESWTLGTGRTIMEISRKAKDTEKQLKKFHQIVARLVAAGAKPIDRSKTDLGSE